MHTNVVFTARSFSGYSGSGYLWSRASEGIGLSIFYLCHTFCFNNVNKQRLNGVMWCNKTARDTQLFPRCDVFPGVWLKPALGFSAGEWVWQTNNAVRPHCHSIRKNLTLLRHDGSLFLRHGVSSIPFCQTWILVLCLLLFFLCYLNQSMSHLFPLVDKSSGSISWLYKFKFLI